MKVIWTNEKKNKMKMFYEFGNDPMKMCFEYKIRMKVDHIIKNIIIL